MPAPRFARVVTALLGGVLVAATAGTPAQAATVSIRSFSVSPAKIGAAGGKITFKARTTGATSCSLTSSVKLKGLPATLACSSGSATKTITFPGKVSTANKSVVFSLTARKGSLATTAKVKVTRLASTPRITKLATAVVTGTGSTDSLHVRAAVQYAKDCTLSVSPAVAGLPNTASCAKGEYFKASSIRKNRSGSARVFTVKVTATSATGVTTSRTAKVAQRSTSGALPTISEYGITPSTLSASGGTYTVKAAVAHASTCSLRVTPSLPSQPAPVSCTSGTYSQNVTVPANTTGKARTFTFVFTAATTSASASATITATQPAAAPAPPSISGFSTTPTSFPAAGTSATVSATIARGSTCTLVSSPALAGLTSTPFECPGTSVSRTVTVPTNSGAARTYTFTLKITGPGGSATATLGAGQNAAAPAITSFGANPITIPASGTSVTFTGAVVNATTCTFTLPSALGGAATNTSCTGGSTSNTVVVPANTTGAGRTLTFTLTATGPGGTATSSLGLTQAAPAPKVSWHAISQRVSASGGTYTVSATVSNASTCALSSSPSLGIDTTPVSCASGSFTRDVTFPSNPGAARSYTFTLTVTGPGGTATGTLVVTQPAAAPGVTSFTASPSAVPSTGASVTFTGSVTNATTCTFTPPSSFGSPTNTNCANGSTSNTVVVPANTTGVSRDLTFTLAATGPGGTASGSITITQPAQPVAVTDTTTSPSTITSAGGKVTLGATVTRATSCAWSSTPDLGISTASFSCSGTISTVVTLPANTTSSAKSYAVTLTANGPGGPAYGRYTLTVPPTAPTLTNFSVSPQAIPAAGLSNLTISGTVGNASTCTFTAAPTSLLGDPDVQSCSSGAVSSSGAIPANTTGVTRKLTFSLRVDGPGGYVVNSIDIMQPSS